MHSPTAHTYDQPSHPRSCSMCTSSSPESWFFMQGIWRLSQADDIPNAPGQCASPP